MQTYEPCWSCGLPRAFPGDRVCPDCRKAGVRRTTPSSTDPQTRLQPCARCGTPNVGASGGVLCGRCGHLKRLEERRERMFRSVRKRRRRPRNDRAKTAE